MSVVYTNETGQRLELGGEQTFEEVSDLLSRLLKPGSSLTVQLASGLGIDFQMQPSGKLWVEFYADEVSSAIVTTAVALQVLRRAFEGANSGIKEKYADLISEWEY